MSRIVTFVILLAILIFFAALFYQVISAFLLPLFLAVLLAVIFRPLHLWFVQRFKGHTGWAAAVTTAAILLTVLSPMAVVLTLAVHEANQLRIETGGDLATRIKNQAAKLAEGLGLNEPLADEIALVEGHLARMESILQQSEWDMQTQVALLREAHSLGELTGRLHANLEELGELLRALHQVGIPGRELVADPQVAQRVRLPLPQPLRDSQWSADEQAAVVALLQANQFGPPEELVILDQSARQMVALLSAGTFQADSWLLQMVERLIAQRAASGPVGAAQLTMPERQARFHDAWERARLALQSFRSELYGSPIRAWLVDVLHPTDARVRALLDRGQALLRQWLPGLTGQATAWIGAILVGLVVMVVSLFYFLADGPGMVRSIMRLSPLDDEYERQLLVEFDGISRAVVVATLLSAFVQGLLAGVAYALVGVSAVFLLTMLTMLLALVPFVGAAAVWLPVGLWLLLVEQRWMAAAFLLGYGVIVVSMSDNVIKPFVLHGRSRLHPLLALLSVLGGVQALGPIGILVGPMVVSFLQAVLIMLNQELERFGQQLGIERAAVTPAPAVAGPAPAAPPPASGGDSDENGQTDSASPNPQGKTPRS